MDRRGVEEVGVGVGIVVDTGGLGIDPLWADSDDNDNEVKRPGRVFKIARLRERI
jgi:hypothetical protein